MSFIRLVISILFFGLLCSCIGRDKHPDYPYLNELTDKIDNLHYVSTPNSPKDHEYTLFPLDGQPLYRVKDIFYNLLGDSVASYSFDKIPYGQLAKEQAITGQYIYVNQHMYGEKDTLCLFNMQEGKTEQKLIIYDLEDFVDHSSGRPQANELTPYLIEMGFKFPSIGERPFAGDYKKHKDYLKASKDYEPNKKKVLEKAMSEFLSTIKEKVYLYKNHAYSRKEDCIIFADNHLAVNIGNNINTTGIPSYIMPTKKLSEKIVNPAISFSPAGKAYLGTDIKLIASLVPAPVSSHMYYYELKCDDKTIHFKSYEDNVYLYDFYQTDEKIYFAIEKKGSITLFEYNRSRP